MVEVIRTKSIKKARKTHKCSYCRRDIKIGEPYRRSLLKYDDVYTWNECEFCEAVACEITSSGFYVDDGNGFTAEDYSDVVQELHEAFCTKLDIDYLPRYVEDLYRLFQDKQLQCVKRNNGTYIDTWKLVERSVKK